MKITILTVATMMILFLYSKSISAKENITNIGFLEKYIDSGNYSDIVVISPEYEDTLSIMGIIAQTYNSTVNENDDGATVVINEKCCLKTLKNINNCQTLKMNMLFINKFSFFSARQRFEMILGMEAIHSCPKNSNVYKITSESRDDFFSLGYYKK